MQINLAFFLFGVFHVYEVLYREKSKRLVGYPPLTPRPPVAASCSPIAASRRAALHGGKLCRGPAIAVPWFNRTGDEPAARVVTSARTCSARVSLMLKR